MRNHILTIAIWAIALATSVQASVVTSDTEFFGQLIVTVDGNINDDAQVISLVFDGTTFGIPQQEIEFGDDDLRDLVVVGANGDVDPIASMTVTVTDFGTPTSFAISLTTTIVPIVGLATSELTISGTLTDAAEGDGVSATPFTSSHIGQATVEGLGVLDAGPPASTAGSYGPFTQTTNLDSANFGGSIEAMDVQISFTGSGGGDVINFSATHTLTPVQTPAIPEPTTFAVWGLLGLTLSGACWWRRRR